MPLRVIGKKLIAPLAITLFALFAAQPLFVDQLTCSDDSAFHIGRAVNLEALIDSGHPFPRWSPYMAHGYGYPFFNYYAPLTSYLLVALHKIGFIYTAAFHMALFLCVWSAALATYALGREWWGEAGGLAAAVAYLTAPYFAYDILFRGNLAESFALALPPLILFTLHRALQLRTKPLWGLQGIGVWDFLSALSFAALMLTHNATALAVAPLVAAYIALLAYLQRSPRVLLQGGILISAGLALSAYFWLPALTETGLVQTDKLLVPPIFTYYTNYISMGELFAPPVVIDPLLLNPSPAKALGVIAAALALLGFGAVVWGEKEVAISAKQIEPGVTTSQQWAATRAAPTFSVLNDKHLPFAIWLLVFGAFYAFLTLSVSQFIWDTLPLINFIQFPWRMLAPAALCAALLAGAAVHWLPKHQWVAAAVICLTAALGHLSWWYPRYCAPFRDSTVADTLHYEFDTHTLGTTAKGEYLPRTAGGVPTDDSIAQALMRGDRPTYLTHLPAGSSVTIINPDPLNYQATVTIASNATLTFNQFFFPGWQVAVDEAIVTTTPTSDSGLISFPVSSGRHQLAIQFTNTPLRTAAFAISIISLIGLFACGMALARQPRTQPDSTHLSPLPITVYFLFIPLALLILRPLVIDQTNNPLHYSAFNGDSMKGGQPVNAQLASGLTILSAEFQTAVASGSEFDALLYLTAPGPLPSQYRPRFDLMDANGLLWNNGNEALPPRWHREPPETTQWPAGQYVEWARRQLVLPGTPPGEYELNVTVFDRDSLAPDSLLDENGTPAAPFTALGTIHVTRPTAPPDESAFNIQYRADFDFGPITLLGYNLDRSEARPGDPVLMTFFMQADEPISEALSFNLLEPSYPTSEWQVGDIWRFQVVRHIPAEAAGGAYRFNLALNGLDSPSFDLNPINITVPERLFESPAIANPLAVSFEEAIQLSGYDIQLSDNQLLITLLWQVLATPSADLNVFVHVQDASGQIVAQSDSVPGGGNRPTLGWVPGEYIVDVHALAALPSGSYTVYAGLADKATGIRLPTAAGDRAELGIYKVP